MEKHQPNQPSKQDTPIAKCRSCLDKGYTYQGGNPHYRGIGIPPYTYCRCDLGQKMYQDWKDSPEGQKSIAYYSKKDLEESQVQSHIPPKFREFSIQALKDNPGLFDIVERFLTQYKKGNGNGLYLWGNIGAGKTTTAAIVANELISRYWIDCYMTNWATALSQVKDSFDTKGGPGKNLLTRMRTVELLILDDIHQEKGSDWVKEQLFITINYRYEQGLPTIITSNFPIEDLAERYTQQIASRLMETCKIVEFGGEDRRQVQRSIF